MWMTWRSCNTEYELQMFKVTFRCYKKSHVKVDIIIITCIQPLSCQQTNFAFSHVSCM